MSMDRNNYPDNWEAFSSWVRHVRALDRCECEGECGLHRDHPGPRRCVEVNGRRAKFMTCGACKGDGADQDGLPCIGCRGSGRPKVILTVAHLNQRGGPCQCEPRCAIETHVRAMCQRCHLRLDSERHRRSAADTREAKRNKGQRKLFQAVIDKQVQDEISGTPMSGGQPIGLFPTKSRRKQ